MKPFLLIATCVLAMAKALTTSNANLDDVWVGLDLDKCLINVDPFSSSLYVLGNTVRLLQSV